MKANIFILIDLRENFEILSVEGTKKKKKMKKKKKKKKKEALVGQIKVISHQK